jgi:DNA-binding response OmpR family regulator
MADKKTILIVEDETPVREALADEFKAQKFNVLMAPNGEDGLTLALQAQPDVILLDVVMPKMDGITMLLRLREDPKGKTVPVIFLTNYGETKKIVEATKGNAYGYLIKSNWKISDVTAKVKEALEMK